MSSDFNFTVASWFLGKVHIKPISTHSAPKIFWPSDIPESLTIDCCRRFSTARWHWSLKLLILISTFVLHKMDHFSPLWNCIDLYIFISNTYNEKLSPNLDILINWVSSFSVVANNPTQKFKIPISIDISIKTHQFLCIR